MNVIATIRASKDKKDAKERLMKAYQFTERQAEAIVMLQLYRLTNTDITELQKEADELKKLIINYTEILNSEKKLLQVITKDLTEVKKKYHSDRRTKIESEIEEIKINLEVTVPSEDVVVSVTREGYIKRTSIRSYAASNVEDLQMKENDIPLHIMEINTQNTLLLFTNKGNYLYIPVHELPEIRWKDMGQHIANLIPIDRDEKIIKAIPVRNFDEPYFVLAITKNGMIKKTKLSDYKVQRYSRPIVGINLKDQDEVVNVHLTNGHNDIFIATNSGYGLWFHENEVNPIGIKAAGVKSITLKDDENVVNGEIFDELETPSLFIVTQRGACKRMNISEFEQSNRARRGLTMLRELKQNPHRIVGFYVVKEDQNIYIETENGEHFTVMPLEFRPNDRYSNGSFVVDTDTKGEVVYTAIEPTYMKYFEDEQ